MIWLLEIEGSYFVDAGIISILELFLVNTIC